MVWFLCGFTGEPNGASGRGVGSRSVTLHPSDRPWSAKN